MNDGEPLALQNDGDVVEQLPPVQTSVSELFDTEKLDKKWIKLIFET